ncbi:hypothetical protein [Cronobacter sakazakii]|uniref:hypothetical protein n=1 Tax=Cronobacter sakazakii TaxID=28141 RepID=UPI0028114848|nr:hypothetical protein [Cronobacter sakazakii]MDQ9186175.1 hypothetical protein [Cronobacter sakazakii]
MTMSFTELCQKNILLFYKKQDVCPGPPKPQFHRLVSFRNYEGILVQFNLKPGTRAQLEGIGFRDSSDLAAATHPDMPRPLKSKGGGFTNTPFKGEGDQINIGLGRDGGAALKIFNDGIDSFNMLRQ